jgi:signal transduction histidine kinase
MDMKSAHNELILAAVAGTILFFILIAFCISYIVIYRKKRREDRQIMQDFRKQLEEQLLQSRVEVQEQTFQHIGKELHDNIGQLLSSSLMLLNITERNLPEPPDTLLTANSTLAEGIVRLRSLSRSLDQEWLERFNLHNNLAEEVQRINSSGAISVTYEDGDQLPLSADQQIMLFRIVQEGIQNAIKHAQPTAIHIASRLEGDHFSISIMDNGKGFNTDIVTHGMGLNNMRHRSRLLGGNISWKALPPSGTMVQINLPIKQS